MMYWHEYRLNVGGSPHLTWLNFDIILVSSLKYQQELQKEASKLLPTFADPWKQFLHDEADKNPTKRVGDIKTILSEVTVDSVNIILFKVSVPEDEQRDMIVLPEYGLKYGELYA